MFPVRQVGPSVVLTAGTWSAASSNGSFLRVFNPNTTPGYFMQSPPASGGGTPTGAPAGTTGIPVGPNESVIVDQAQATGYWGAVTEGLVVTPVELPRIY
jgi:hypothetical protein